jgi:AraC-like DNA-binding protein
LAGIRDTLNGTVNSEEDHRLTIAKQYIEDNICQPISVSELASYCYISEKQLGRIFVSECGLTVMEYIRKMKCRQIEKMLSDPSLSLRQISEKMNFNNEYHFNSFFKKYAGMSPGTYRKAIIKQ